MRALGQAGPASFFLATVASVSGPEGLTIIPDGQTEAVPKKYKVLLAGTEPPAVGARVVVMRHSGTCIILGTIGLPQDLDADDRIGTLEDEVGELGTALTGKVSKAGDTMTGDLNLKSTSHTIGTAPATTASDRRLYFRDLAGTVFGKLQSIFTSANAIGVQLGAQRTVNGSLIENNVNLYVNADGTRSVVFTEPAKWRGALGIGTNGAFPLTVAQGGTGSTNTVSETTAANIATAASGMSITTAGYYAWGKIAMFYIKFKVTTATTAGAWHELGTLKAGKIPPCTTFAQELNNAIVFIDTNGRIYVWGEWPVNKEFEITATYLLP